MSIAVLLSTRNGARTLSAVLAAHAALRPAAVPHRLIIVDNGSTDATPALLAEVAAAGRPAVEVLREELPGKNRALNRALPLVLDAELVVFTDDDAVPEPDWLQRLWNEAQLRRGYGILGGAILPRWMVPPPSWIQEWRVPLDICYAATATHREGQIDPTKVWGPNMVVRGAVLREGHRFDASIGPDGSPTYPMGSEIEFTSRLARAGHRAWYTPHAVVHHLVRPEQMTEEWVLQRAFRCGRGAAQLHARMLTPRGLRRARLAPGLWLRVAGYGAGVALARHVLPPSRLRFWLEWQSSLMRGKVVGLRPPPVAAAAAATGGSVLEPSGGAAGPAHASTAAGT